MHTPMIINLQDGAVKKLWCKEPRAGALQIIRCIYLQNDRK